MEQNYQTSFENSQIPFSIHSSIHFLFTFTLVSIISHLFIFHHHSTVQSIILEISPSSFLIVSLIDIPPTPSLFIPSLFQVTVRRRPHCPGSLYSNNESMFSHNRGIIRRAALLVVGLFLLPREQTARLDFATWKSHDCREKRIHYAPGQERKNCLKRCRRSIFPILLAFTGNHGESLHRWSDSFSPSTFTVIFNFSRLQY